MLERIGDIIRKKDKPSLSPLSPTERNRLSTTSDIVREKLARSVRRKILSRRGTWAAGVASLIMTPVAVEVGGLVTGGEIGSQIISGHDISNMGYYVPVVAGLACLNTALCLATGYAGINWYRGNRASSKNAQELRQIEERLQIESELMKRYNASKVATTMKWARRAIIAGSTVVGGFGGPAGVVAGFFGSSALVEIVNTGFSWVTTSRLNREAKRIVREAEQNRQLPISPTRR